MVIFNINKSSLFFIICEIFSFGLGQWAYPTQFTTPSVHSVMPNAFQPNCYTVCYPPPPPVAIPIPVNLETCTASPITPPVTPPVAPPTPTSDPIPTTEPPSTTNTPEVIVVGHRKKNFTVNFELGNYPLDVYYLMDYSSSFTDHKNTLVALSPKFIDSIAALSSDYQLGFGSFIDKPVRPFGVIGPPADYSYWNQVSLTKDTSSFTKTVSDTPIGISIDVPEAIFDGLFQAAACTSDIGWRANARKIILVTTDAEYHKAGDGSSATSATLSPFDEKCHLDANGKYTEEAILDYPSEDQIKRVIEENQITVIFAITTDAIGNYTELSSHIKSSKLATLSMDSSNIIDVLKEAYNELSSSIEIEASGSTADFTINYYSKCSGVAEMQTAMCALPPSGSISYTVEVEVDCPVDPSKKLSFNPIGVPSNVDIDTSSICV